MTPPSAPRAACVIVTRAQDEATRWVQALQARGVQARALPLITIEALHDVQPLQHLWQDRIHYSALMFVSANAVRHFMQALPDAAAPQVPAHLRAWATGPGTQAALLAQGWPPEQIDVPDAQSQVWDSEGLWVRVEATVQPGQKVLIVRGADDSGQMAGRDWLARQLTAAGVQVLQCLAYVRRCPSWGEHERSLALQYTRQSCWWLFSSSQAAEHLQQLCPDLPVQDGKAMATHPRIAQRLQTLGWGRVEQTAPGLASLVESIESLA